MLHNIKELEGCAIHATNGEIGRVRDCYFDDQTWVVRYLVVEAGSWLASRKVLISPIAVVRPDWAGKRLPVAITKEQVRNSPDFDTDKPVSRQSEASHLSFYGFADYWSGAGIWGDGMYPGMLLSGYPVATPMPQKAELEMEEAYARAEEGLHANDDPHLRSCNAVTGYHIHASDGDIGHVQGMLVDQDTWAIRYFVVDTSNWWLGHQVLIAPQWIHNVSWAEATVLLNVSRQAVKASPPYDPEEPLEP